MPSPLLPCRRATAAGGGALRRGRRSARGGCCRCTSGWLGGPAGHHQARCILLPVRCGLWLAPLCGWQADWLLRTAPLWPKAGGLLGMVAVARALMSAALSGAAPTRLLSWGLWATGVTCTRPSLSLCLPQAAGSAAQRVRSFHCQRRQPCAAQRRRRQCVCRWRQQRGAGCCQHVSEPPVALPGPLLRQPLQVGRCGMQWQHGFVTVAAYVQHAGACMVLALRPPPALHAWLVVTFLCLFGSS